MKRTLFIFLLTGISLSSFSLPNELSNSKPLKNNSVYLELGGNFLYSLNYENLIQTSKSMRIAVGSGLEYLPDIEVDGTKTNHVFCLTPSVNFLFGKTSHKLETGVSLFVPMLVGAILPSARLGYRYQPVNGGFLFRIAFTPMVSHSSVIPWAGISVGYTF